MKKHLDRLQAKAAKANEEFILAVRAEQQTCAHETLAECQYQPSRVVDGYASPPMRVCLDCGIAEEGWGPGYVVLRGEARTISRDELYRLRQGITISDDEKGPLLRREVTVAQMVAAS